MDVTDDQASAGVWPKDATYGTCMGCTQAVRLRKVRGSDRKVINQHKAKRVWSPHVVATVICTGADQPCAEDLGYSYDSRAHMRQWVKDEDPA